MTLSCLRCARPVPPNRIVLLALVEVTPERDAISAFLAAPTLVVCSTCKATIQACLERGTRLTPIVASPKRGALGFCNRCDRTFTGARDKHDRACMHERSKTA